MARTSLDLARRDLLRRLPAAAAFLYAHEIAAGLPAAPRRPPDPSASHRIRAISLRTAAPLDALERFYRGAIGLEILHRTRESITLAAGGTELTFVADGEGEAPADRSGPHYHFAFNIPPHKLRAARAWQLERTPLVPPRPGLVDPGWPEDVWSFRHWNARSIFFFDPAFNIVEYIARSELESEGDPASFSAADVLYASEIGFVFDGPGTARAARSLHERLGLAAYPAGTEPWWAMGDALGLVLCLSRKGQVWGETSPTPVRWGVYPTEATISGSKPGVHEIEGGPYRLRVV
jgi:hypothetical protein